MQIVELQEYIMNLDFDNVWDFMNKYVLSEDKQESVLIPEIEEWHEIKNLLINKKKVSRSDYRKFSSITASLPPSIKVRSGLNLRVSPLMIATIKDNPSRPARTNEPNSFMIYSNTANLKW